jgi:HEAT repeat protein
MKADQVHSQPIFLSYSSLQRPFAARLAADIKNAGFALWMDQFDIRSGENWDHAIAKAIDACAGVIAVLSPAYVASEICLNELERAQRAGLPIYPVLLERILNQADWPIVIQRRQYVDFTAWTTPLTYRARLTDLLGELHKHFAGQAGAIPDLETRYLNSLLAELESSRGVLEYVPLEAQAPERDPGRRREQDEWAFDILLDVKPGPFGERTTRLYEVDALAKEQPLLVLVGEAGAGKTTTLRWLARRSALARRAAPKLHPLPVLLSLGDWRDDRSFEDVLKSSCPPLREIDLSLAAGDLLLLLDGLNEMGAPGPEKVRAVRAWLDNLPVQPRCVMTCRSREYVDLKLSDVPTATLRDLDESQIRQFASRYLLSRASSFLAQVLPATPFGMDARSAIGDLARNPYMLSAFILLYQSSPDETLPTNTGALFAKLAGALWTREERRRRRSGQQQMADWGTARSALAGLALRMIEANESDDEHVARIVEILGGADLFDGAVQANLLMQNGDFARFHHDLLRCYFAAEALRDAAVETLRTWVRGHVPFWEPVAVAWSGISPDADGFLKRINWEDAAELIGRGYAASEEALRVPARRAMQELAVDHWRSFQPAMDALTQMGRAVVPLLLENLASAEPEMRAKIAFVLGRIGDPRAVDSLLVLVGDASTHVRSRAITALLNIGGERAVSALARHTAHESVEMRVAAAKAIGGLSHAGYLDSLIALLADRETSVRLATIESLGLLRDVRAADFVASFVDDDDPDIRASAVEALGRLGRPEDLDRASRALHDSVLKVRLAGIRSVQALGGAHASTLLIQACSDENKEVRELAAATLAETGDPESVDHLLSAFLESSPAVQRKIARALGRIGGLDVQNQLVERLRGDDASLWAPCAEALEVQGWTPLSNDDHVRWCAAKGRWAGCLALGSDAVPELRNVLRLGDDNRRRGTVEILRKLDWYPREPGLELFRYHVARVDWIRQDRMNPVELVSLSGWLSSIASDASPARAAVAEMLNQLDVAPCGTELNRALESSDVRIQYLATITAGMANCLDSADVLLSNLNAPAGASPVFEQGAIRAVSAQALGDLGFVFLTDLLEHASRDIKSGILTYSDASAIAAIQSAARIAGVSPVFNMIPASALGRKAAKPQEGWKFDVWLMFGFSDDSVMEKVPVSEAIRAIVNFDRSTLPAYSPFHSEVAYWELHKRMAALSLLWLSVFPREYISQPATKALRTMDQMAVEAILTQAHTWAGEHVVSFANAELERRGQAN